MAEKKVVVFGLDCATPQLVFDKWAKDLPHLSRLMERGISGPMQSCIPPITIPAWSCMMTSKNPGKLGCYGFRNRSDYSYDGLSFATSKAVKEAAKKVEKADATTFGDVNETLQALKDKMENKK